jgi:hypothetical protein
MPPAEPERPPEAAATAAPPRRAPKLAIDEIILVVLLTLSAVGIAISEILPRAAFGYWLAMVPVFGGISLFAGWSRAREQGMTAVGVLRSQLLHWIALAVAVCLVFLLEYTGRMSSEDAALVFLLEYTGRMSSEDAALVALLALALTTFLAGVHFDWRYCVIGALLAAAVAALAVLQEFLWVIVIAAVAVAAFLAYRARRGAPSGGSGGSRVG